MTRLDPTSPPELASTAGSGMTGCSGINLETAMNFTKWWIGNLYQNLAHRRNQESSAEHDVEARDSLVGLVGMRLEEPLAPAHRTLPHRCGSSRVQAMIRA
ncbi:MAG: hypothetical protein OXC25_14050 [Thiotrichales bacterium]|nr:hypothetical protein [Thiotrichales bacterium]